MQREMRANPARPEHAGYSRELELLCTAAQLVLENGGETYRVEETVMRMAAGMGIERVGVSALPTSISVEVGGLARIRRISHRGTNMARLAATNDVSRRVACGEMGIEQAEAALAAVAAQQGVSQRKLILACGLAAASFSLLFGGGAGTFAVTFLIGMLIQAVQPLFSHMEMGSLFGNFAGGLITAVCAQAAGMLFPFVDVNAAIIGGILPLLSGLLMVTAARDTMYGDLVSGVARAVEAVLLAASVALGVYVGLKLVAMMGGVIL